MTGGRVTSDAGAADLISQLRGGAVRARSRARRPIQPLTSQVPATHGARTAYRIQQANVERRLSAANTSSATRSGSRPEGHAGDVLAFSEPDYGHLIEHDVARRARAARSRVTLIDPQIEIEPAFVLGSRLRGPGVGVADVLAATEYVCVCFRGHRFAHHRLACPAAGYGGRQRFERARSARASSRHRPESRWISTTWTPSSSWTESFVETGNTSAILGHPANGIAWLANRISEFGLTLEAGHVVLPGTCMRCPSASAATPRSGGPHRGISAR